MFCVSVCVCVCACVRACVRACMRVYVHVTCVCGFNPCNCICMHVCAYDIHVCLRVCVTKTFIWHAEEYPVLYIN